MRQIVLDTETTGLDAAQGHRIIEIGCVELINRRPTNNHFHQYLQPDREIDEGALEVHGISSEFLRDKPRFAEVADSFLAFIEGAELVIHNAAFDIGFLDHEFGLLDRKLGTVNDLCSVIDTLALARRMHPGQRNSLDALCKRYDIDNSQRDLHGALLDARILADVYLAMTGGQVTLLLDAEDHSGGGQDRNAIRRLVGERPRLSVVRASDTELSEHAAWLDRLDEAAEGGSLWRRLEIETEAEVEVEVETDG